MGGLASGVRARGTLGSSVAERASPLGGDVIFGVLEGDSEGEILGVDLELPLPSDRFLDEPPMIPRKKPRSPDSFSRSPSSTVDVADWGRPSVWITCEMVEKRLAFCCGVSMGAEGVGGSISLKVINELAEATWLSVRMMSSLRPGAGLHGAVDGKATCLASASSRMYKNQDHSVRRHSKSLSRMRLWNIVSKIRYLSLSV